ncbi:MAG: NAD(P)-binding domain-containing protein, partial [Prevotellaceae bacterium]|nr:NAD(P)-binding domain-containing protein [Prevotellaceae bacterium]
MSTVAVAGAGNMATSLVPALKKSGFEITRIYSRTFEHAENIAVKVNAKP